jgi:hypothetical protein
MVNASLPIALKKSRRSRRLLRQVPKENPDRYFFCVLVLAKNRWIFYALCYMASQLGWRKALLCGFAFSSLLGAFVNIGSNYKQDRSWKRYRNPAFGYCVSYPSHWLKADAFEGAGLFVKTGINRYSRPLGEIDLGVLAGPPPQDARVMPVSLVQDLRDHLDGLRRFERAERMEVLENRQLQFLGNAALFTKNRYYDPQDRDTWVDEVLFVNRHETLYRLELECRADQLTRFEPVFSHLMGTFEFDCAPER